MKRRTIRIVALVMLVVFSTQSLCGAASKLPDYEPYTKDEFPIWTGKLRRAESLFFGSFPITLPVTILAYNVAVNLGAPPIEDPAGFKTAMIQVGIAAGLSFGIALADYIIGEVRGE